MSLSCGSMNKHLFTIFKIPRIGQNSGYIQVQLSKPMGLLSLFIKHVWMDMDMCVYPPLLPSSHQLRSLDQNGCNLPCRCIGRDLSAVSFPVSVHSSTLGDQGATWSWGRIICNWQRCTKKSGWNLRWESTGPPHSFLLVWNVNSPDSRCLL